MLLPFEFAVVSDCVEDEMDCPDDLAIFAIFSFAWVELLNIFFNNFKNFSKTCICIGANY